MNWSVLISNLMTGGFLKGKRTAILGLASLIMLASNYVVGDVGLMEFLNGAKEQIVLTLGLFTAAASGNS